MAAAPDPTRWACAFAIFILALALALALDSFLICMEGLMGLGPGLGPPACWVNIGIVTTFLRSRAWDDKKRGMNSRESLLSATALIGAGWHRWKSFNCRISVHSSQFATIIDRPKIDQGLEDQFQSASFDFERI